jgi:hypothetical protein
LKLLEFHASRPFMIADAQSLPLGSDACGRVVGASNERNGLLHPELV